MSASRRGLGTKKLKRVTRLLPLYWMGLAFRGSGVWGVGFGCNMGFSFIRLCVRDLGFGVWGSGGSELK